MPTHSDILAALLAALADASLAIWEGGSAANGRSDELSDVDLHVIVADEHVEEAFCVAQAALEVLGTLDTPYRLSEPTWHGHSQCFHHIEGTPPTLLVDLVVMRESAPDHFLDPERHGHGVVHLDRGGYTRAPVFDAAAHRERMVAAREDIASRARMFGAFVDKELRRGRTIDAISFYHSLTLRPLLMALGMIHRPLTFDFGRYAHEDLPEEVLSRLAPLYYVADPAELALKQAQAHAWLLELLGSELLGEDALRTLSEQVRRVTNSTE